MEKINMHLSSESMDEPDIDLRSFMYGYVAGLEVGKVYERDRRLKKRLKKIVNTMFGRPDRITDNE